MAGNNMMRAVEIGRPFGIDGLRHVERPIPRLGPTQILLRMRAAALNFRDLMFARDQYLTPIRPGLIPLSDGAGEVVELGRDVSRFRLGDRAVPNFFQGWISGPPFPAMADTDTGRANDGTLCQYMAIDQEAAVVMPDHLSFAQGAALPCAGLTAWTALFGKVQLLPGDTVLVQGTGGVSLFVLQFAKIAGFRVIATTSTARKADLLRALGADGVINYRDTPEWGQAVLNLTGGRGVDLVVDVSGGGTMDQSILATRFGGTIGLVGIVGDVLAGAFEGMKLTSLLMGRVSAIPVGVGNRDDFDAMNRAIAYHRITPVIDGTMFGFEAAKDAYRHLEQLNHVGKVVINID